MNKKSSITIPVSDGSEDELESSGTPPPADAPAQEDAPVKAEEASNEATETATKTNSVAPDDSPKDVFEQTKALQLQAWQSQSDLDSILDAMTQDELKSYKEEVAGRQQASEEGSEERAVWDVLLFAAGVKQEHKQLQKTEEHIHG
jgi:hypothetical protein